MKKAYLSEIENVEIQKFNENIVMREAVRKVLLEGIYYQGKLMPDKPAEMTKNFALELSGLGVLTYTDEQIGQDLRGTVSAIRYLEAGFQELAKIKVEVKKEESTKINKAR